MNITQVSMDISMNKTVNDIENDQFIFSYSALIEYSLKDLSE